MKVGDLVKVPNEWIRFNGWMEEGWIGPRPFEVGIIVSDDNFGLNYFYVLIGGEVKRITMCRLQPVKENT